MIRYVNLRVGGEIPRGIGDREHLITKLKPEEKILR